MNRTQSTGLLLAAVLLGSAASGMAGLTLSSFSDDLAPANWNPTYVSAAHGSYVFASATKLDLSASADNVASDLILTSSQLTQTTTISLSWTLTANGGISGAAWYYVDGQATALVGSSGTINLNNIAAGATLGFEVSSSGTTPDKNPVVFEVDVVPEAGTWLAVAFLAGVAGFEAWRRKASRAARVAARVRS